MDRLVAQGLQLGEGTHIGHPIYIDQLHPWLITIDDYAMLGPYVAIITHDASLNQHTGQTRLGRVTVGKRVHIGVGAILLPGTSIGDDSVVGAAAVVHGDIPPGSLVIGNPAKASPIKPRGRLASGERCARSALAGRRMDDLLGHHRGAQARAARSAGRRSLGLRASRACAGEPVRARPTALVEFAPTRADGNPHGRPDGGRAAKQGSH